MQSKEYVLLLGADQYLRERAFSGAKQATDLPVWAATEDAVRKPNRTFDNMLAADPKDAESLLAAIRAHSAQGWHPRIVVPLNDWTVESASTVNRVLGLDGLDATAVTNARNKHAMKQAFHAAGIPTPRSQLVRSEQELLDAVKAIGLPVVIKPYDFGGSGGVVLATTREEAVAGLAESKAVIAKYRSAFDIRGDKYLVERFVDSDDEVSLEVLCGRGRAHVLAVTEKYLSSRPWFAEIAHLVPSHRTEDPMLTDLATRACAALGIDRGLAHVEIKFAGDGTPWVIEVAARPGGDGIMDQVERACSINPYWLHVGSYLGSDLFDVAGGAKPTKTSAIAFLKAPPGRIKDVLDGKPLPPEVRSINISAKPGDRSHAAKNWSTREGLIELEWDELFGEKTSLPVTIAKEISEQVFVIEDAVGE
ncbi:ATP-grasp domain-containing protein [Actinomadura sp. KC216]|uniref:ATP-grasp domain-containing protein n=1 Tax=Actinomadura sp. KC216 TaxID=2530370 RepID=UPI001043E034|nr:ATP-grasp domain-containing protein [Actinomadura sp. KC216]TDB87737.1 ATP-grasp domain-containing protein [Actinomadura sp. KC216]